MTRGLPLILLLAILGASLETWGDLQLVSRDSTKEVYTDTETRTTLWRLTTDPQFDQSFYYLYPGYSPDGRFIAYYCGGIQLCLMNSDGSNEHVLGKNVDWNAVLLPGESDSWALRTAGWWSKDSKYLYTTDLGRVDVIAQTVKRLPNQPRAAMFPFRSPMLSPDGLHLIGHNWDRDLPVEGETCQNRLGGCKFRFIKVDGTDFWEAAVPFPDGSTGALDISYSPLGNNHLVFWTASTAYGDYLYKGAPVVNAVRWIEPVAAIDRGRRELRLAGLLSVDLPNHPNGFYYGHFGHLTLSPDAYFLGNEEGGGQSDWWSWLGISGGPKQLSRTRVRA